MKNIQKGKEPESLLLHRKNTNAHYENYREKDGLREALLKEQGFLCCYCMRRISKATMKIEHWQSQVHFPERQLDYKNLLGSCKGGEGEKAQSQHCDTHKGDRSFSLNPAQVEHHCEERISFLANGEIFSNEARINRELEETLNLNHSTLKKNRGNLLSTFIKEFSRKYPKKTWTPNQLLSEMERWRSLKKKGEYREYCQVVVCYLQKKLKRLAR